MRKNNNHTAHNLFLQNYKLASHHEKTGNAQGKENYSDEATTKIAVFDPIPIHLALQIRHSLMLRVQVYSSIKG